MLVRIPGGILVALERVETWLAVVFGVCFSISLYCFALIDYLPRTGIRILALTGLTFFIGGVGGYYLIRWLRTTLVSFPVPRRWFLLGLGVLLCAFLFFTGTRSWQDPHRYPDFLLPQQNVTLEILADPSQPDPQISITWFTTPHGEISFDTASYQGWQRQDDRLVLVDKTENNFAWHGKTGDKLTFVFRLTDPVIARAIVNGSITETTLGNSSTTEETLALPIPVPFYASRTAMQIAAFISLCVLSLALVLALAGREDRFVQSFQKSFRRFSLIDTQFVPHHEMPICQWEIWVILGVILGGFLLRVFNLDALYPYVDEYSHLLAAKSILQGEPILSVYRRSLITVTIPVVAFFKLFGMSVWAARLPGVIVNSLAIWPLYLSLRKMNRPIAVIAVLLFATSPWVISVARSTREYAYYPLYFFFIVYAMLTVLQHMPNGIIVDRGFWKQLSWHWLIPLLFLALPAVYALTFDRQSTLKVVLIAYGVFALFLLAKLDWKSKTNWIAIGILSVIMAGFTIYLINNIPFIEFRLDLDSLPASLFFPNPHQQWYYNRSNLLPLLAVFSAMVIAFQQRRYTVVPLFFVSTLAVYLIFFSVFFSRYFRPRYIFSVQFWYIIVLAIGIYLLWMLFTVLLPSKRLRLALAILFTVVSFNPMQILLPALHHDHEFHPISVEYHYNLENVDAYIREHMQPTDALIFTVYGNYVRFVDRPKFFAMCNYDPTDPDILQVLDKFMNKNPSGWIVIDANRYKDAVAPLPQESLSIGDAQIEYIGMIDDELIWRWETPDA